MLGVTKELRESRFYQEMEDEILSRAVLPLLTCRKNPEEFTGRCLPAGKIRKNLQLTRSFFGVTLVHIKEHNRL